MVSDFGFRICFGFRYSDFGFFRISDFEIRICFGFRYSNFGFRSSPEGGPMPTYKYEAMDTTGAEVKDTVDAGTEEEAQQKIRQMGYFVTRLTEVAGRGGKKKKGKAAVRGKRMKTMTLGGVKTKQLVTFTRQFSV